MNELPITKEQGYDPTPDYDARIDFDNMVEEVRGRLKSMPMIHQNVWHYLYDRRWPLRRIAQKLKRPLSRIWTIKKEIWRLMR